MPNNSYKEVLIALNTIIEQSPQLLEDMKEKTLLREDDWDVHTYKHEGEYEEVITYKGYDVEELLICVGEITLCNHEDLSLLERQYKILGDEWYEIFKLSQNLIKNKPSNFIPILLLLSDSFDDCFNGLCHDLDLNLFKKELKNIGKN